MKIYEEDYIPQNYNFRKIKYKINNNNCWICISHKTGTHGYPRARRNGVVEKLHRYICKLEIGRIPEDKLVLHKCGNKKCINPEHLKIGTHKENGQDAIRLNERACGEEIGSSKLTKKEVIKIKKLIKKGETLTKIAEEFGVSQSNISLIKNNKRWKHITI